MLYSLFVNLLNTRTKPAYNFLMFIFINISVIIALSVNKILHCYQ